MRPIRLSVSSQTSSNWIPLDIHIKPFNIGIGVALSAGSTMTYQIEHTYDDVFSPSFNPATAEYLVNSAGAKSADFDFNYAFPVTAVRLTVTSYTSGTATMTIVQAGLPG